MEKNIEAGAKQEMIGKYYETRTQMSKLISIDDIKDATMASNKAQRKTYEQGIRKATLDKVLELIEEMPKFRCLDMGLNSDDYIVIKKSSLVDLFNRIKNLT